VQAVTGPVLAEHSHPLNAVIRTVIPLWQPSLRSPIVAT
jgi:hypothetical protein